MNTMQILFFLFLAFTAKPFLGAVDAESDAVLDSEGDELKPGSQYYIVSAIIGAGGGGVTLSPTRNNDCPIAVAQERSDLNNGIAVTFSPANSTESVIRESADVNVIFTSSPDCAGSLAPVWKVDNYDKSTGQWPLSIGGTEGNPGSQTLLNWFKIEKLGTTAGVYRLVHCPSVCDSCIHLCSDVGKYWEEELPLPRLVLSEHAFVVVFMKAETSAKKRISSVI